MKQSVKTIVDSIEKEISTILENPEYESNQYGIEKDFEFVTFTFYLSYNEIPNKFADEWENKDIQTEIEVKSVTVTVTNENSKVLTNLSTEVFNQLELTYTNY